MPNKALKPVDNSQHEAEQSSCPTSWKVGVAAGAASSTSTAILFSYFIALTLFNGFTSLIGADQSKETTSTSVVASIALLTFLVSLLEYAAFPETLNVKQWQELEQKVTNSDASSTTLFSQGFFAAISDTKTALKSSLGCSENNADSAQPLAPEGR